MPLPVPPPKSRNEIFVPSEGILRPGEAMHSFLGPLKTIWTWLEDSSGCVQRTGMPWPVEFNYLWVLAFTGVPRIETPADVTAQPVMWSDQLFCDRMLTANGTAPPDVTKPSLLYTVVTGPQTKWMQIRQGRAVNPVSLINGQYRHFQTCFIHTFQCRLKYAMGSRFLTWKILFTLEWKSNKTLYRPYFFSQLKIVLYMLKCKVKL